MSTTTSKKTQEHLAFKAQRAYFKALQNYLGVVRNGLVNGQEERTMKLQVDRLYREWQLLA